MSLKKGSHISNISIHASTRGATNPFAKFYKNLSNFNPRFHERSDLKRRFSREMKTFQSTLPREERRKSTRANRSSVKISIHASTRGATDSDLSECFKIHISIHASTRGATQFLSLVSSRLQISIHASTRGATNRKSYNGERKTISIHASTRGAT